MDPETVKAFLLFIAAVAVSNLVVAGFAYKAGEASAIDKGWKPQDPPGFDPPDPD